MCDFLSLATVGVQQLQPYQAGKPIEELERELGISNIIKLASNENPLGPSPKVLQALKELCTPQNVALYPDGSGFGLKKALANHYNIPQEMITLGNGSNDVLEFIARAFVTSDLAVMFSQYAFAVYPIVTQAIGAEMQIVPAKNWGHDLEEMLKRITEKTRVIFIANPNNPTGTWLNKNDLESFLNQVSKKIIVVLDEAYIEYIENSDFPNSLEWLETHPNIIITRTFSKAYGLASLRVGYSISNPQIADLLNRVRQPFNVNSFALKAAEVALNDKDHLKQAVALNKQGIQQFENAFKNMNLDYISSAGNFISVDVKRNGGEIYQLLLKEGVIVRPVGNYGMPTFLRISIGLFEENSRCIQALQKVLQ
jgi:histidinol-phosphate aminotransferase